MKSPRTLRKGDLISLVAPAKKLDSETLEFATRFLESNGFRVERGPNSLNSFSQFSGTDEERLSDFQQALDNPEVKAIICLRGGYGSMRIIDRLDWKTFRKKPKWICGFSDITTFHSYCHQVLETQSLHCSMPLNFEANSAEALESLKDALQDMHQDIDTLLSIGTDNEVLENELDANELFRETSQLLADTLDL